jgi:hypothetical protein
MSAKKLSPWTNWRRARGTAFPPVRERAPLHALQLLRIHQTLRVTRAMEAGISDHVCSLDEVIALLD